MAKLHVDGDDFYKQIRQLAEDVKKEKKEKHDADRSNKS